MEPTSTDLGFLKDANKAVFDAMAVSLLTLLNLDELSSVVAFALG
jgi:hypothetical protein